MKDPVYRHFDHDRADSLREHYNDQDDLAEEKRKNSMDLTQCKSVEEYRNAAHFWQKKWKAETDTTAALRRDLSDLTTQLDAIFDGRRINGQSHVEALRALIAKLDAVTKERDEARKKLTDTEFNLESTKKGHVVLGDLLNKGRDMNKKLRRELDTALARAEAGEKAMQSIRSSFARLETAGCSCYSDPEGPCEYCKEAESITETLNEALAAIDAAGGTVG